MRENIASIITLSLFRVDPCICDRQSSCDVD